MKKVVECEISIHRLGVWTRYHKYFDSMQQAREYVWENILPDFCFSPLFQAIDNCKYLVDRQFPEIIKNYLTDPHYILPKFRFSSDDCRFGCTYSYHYGCGKNNPPCDKRQSNNGDKYHCCDGCEFNFPCPDEKQIFESIQTAPNIMNINKDSSEDFYLLDEETDKGILDFTCVMPIDDWHNFSIHITFKSTIYYDVSEYPFLILRTLSRAPITSQRLSDKIRAEATDHKFYRTTLDQQIKRLQKLGFPIEHSHQGYYLVDIQDFKNCATYSREELQGRHSFYPLMILKVLTKQPQTQAQIADSVKIIYGVSIERKAIGRHLKNLMSFNLAEKSVSNTGFCLK